MSFWTGTLVWLPPEEAARRDRVRRWIVRLVAFSIMAACLGMAALLVWMVA